ncbi:MAG: 50S ribosomal protein L6, partial [Pseudomonadota bacterium]
MSRLAKKPFTIPTGVEINLNANELSVKGSKGTQKLAVHPQVSIVKQDNVFEFKAKDGSRKAREMLGTTRALVNNVVKGVSEGFERKLQLKGVGYRAQAQGKKLNLTLGLSHPVVYQVPEGITIETPAPTEIVIKGVDKQLVGQTAAEIRRYRPPEPYKGKG